MENKIYIDYIISNASSIKLNKLNNEVLNSLRLGVYELYFLSSKNYAVINEIVNYVKKINFKSKNFVNAVLRNIDRSKGKFENLDKLNTVDYLSVKYSFNTDLVKYLINVYGNENVEKVLENLNKKAIFSIRIDTNKISKNDLIDRFNRYGLEVRHSEISRDCLIIKNPVNITEFKEFEEGYFTIQDQASILVSEILNPSENAKILDLCAAPGSKSTHLAQISKDNSHIVSNDISESKLYKIHDNFNRMKYKNYETSAHDARHLNEKWVEGFDYVLVDAPCSGIGVIKRKPEIKINRSMNDIKELAKIQEQILENSYKYLKNGGYLVYSTCTVGEIENENNIEKFLKNHKDMEILEQKGEKYLNISLLDSDSDGFFICKMKKKL